MTFPTFPRISEVFRPCRCGAYWTDRDFRSACMVCAKRARQARYADIEWNPEHLADRLAVQAGNLLAESLIWRHPGLVDLP